MIPADAAGPVSRRFKPAQQGVGRNAHQAANQANQPAPKPKGKERNASQSGVRIQSSWSTVSGSGPSPMASRVAWACSCSQAQKALTSGRWLLRGPTSSQ